MADYLRECVPHPFTVEPPSGSIAALLGSNLGAWAAAGGVGFGLCSSSPASCTCVTTGSCNCVRSCGRIARLDPCPHASLRRSKESGRQHTLGSATDLHAGGPEEAISQHQPQHPGRMGRDYGACRLRDTPTFPRVVMPVAGMAKIKCVHHSQFILAATPPLVASHRPSHYHNTAVPVVTP